METSRGGMSDPLPEWSTNSQSKQTSLPSPAFSIHAVPLLTVSTTAATAPWWGLDRDRTVVPHSLLPCLSPLTDDPPFLSEIYCSLSASESRVLVAKIDTSTHTISIEAAAEGGGAAPRQITPLRVVDWYAVWEGRSTEKAVPT